MRLRSLIELLGIKAKPKHYPYRMMNYLLDNKTIHYAQWLHPKESQKIINKALIAGYSLYINEGDFCIDIGAHSGDSTLPMAVAAGKSGCVLALEPNPYVYHVLEKNVRANRHIGNIFTMLAAATPEEGFIRFEYSDSGFCNGGRHEGISPLAHGHAFTLEVFAVNLEHELRQDFAEFLPKLTFIKVDAEGYDLYILKSLSSIIKEFRPIIKAEIFKRTSLSYRTEFLSLLSELDYTGFKIIAEPAVPGDQLTKENLAPGTHFDVLCIPNQQTRKK